MLGKLQQQSQSTPDEEDEVDDDKSIVLRLQFDDGPSDAIVLVIPDGREVVVTFTKVDTFGQGKVQAFLGLPAARDIPVDRKEIHEDRTAGRR